MKKFNIYTTKPGDVFYELKIYYSDDTGDICGYNIKDYLIYDIVSTNDKNIFLIETSNGQYKYNVDNDNLYNTYDDAKKILIKFVNKNIRKIKQEYYNRINQIKEDINYESLCNI